MISVFSAIILGVIEGVTEFLPISSTAHLILASNLLDIPHTNFVKTFEIAVQGGAIMAVVALYRKSFLDWKILKRIILAFIPTSLVGFSLYTFIKNSLLGNTDTVLWSLFIGGLLLILFEFFHKEKDSGETIQNLSYGKCLIIGSFQALAIIPGVSRSAATIVGGMILGLQREEIVRFSFLLAVPTMLTASGFDLLKNYEFFSGGETHILLIGCIVSFITALFSIKMFLSFIRRHTLASFGVYRIALALSYLAFIRP